MDTRSVFLLVFCTFLLMFTWFHALVQTSLGDIHTSCAAFVADLCWFAGALAALPTCFVEGISVGVAGRLLGRFCRVHTGIRFNTIHRQRNTEIKPSALENPRVFIPHMFSVCLPVPPSPQLAFFLSVALSVCLVFQGGWLRFSLLFPVQPPSLLLSARVSLPPSLSLYLPSLSLAPSRSLSLSISQTLSICW